jgi:phosphatidylinositol-3-phosphatase
MVLCGIRYYESHFQRPLAAKCIKYLEMVPCLLAGILVACSTHATGLGRSSTVFVILMENHNWSDIKGKPAAPYINHTLLPLASYAEHYFNPPGVHPSEPNYLWLEAGTNFGILNDDPPSTNHQSTPRHFVTLLKNAGISWRTYQEGVTGSICPTTDNGSYAVKHNPFTFFDDVTGPGCTKVMRPFTELAGDLENNKVPHYVFITPNLCHDMHDPCLPTNNRVKQGDNWLARNLPMILKSAAFHNGVVFIIWDEGEGGDFPIGMIVLSPFAKGGGYFNTIHYTHSATLQTLQKIFGVMPFLGDAANGPDLSDLFVDGAIPEIHR